MLTKGQASFFFFFWTRHQNRKHSFIHKVKIPISQYYSNCFHLIANFQYCQRQSTESQITSRKCKLKQLRPISLLENIKYKKIRNSNCKYLEKQTKAQWSHLGRTITAKIIISLKLKKEDSGLGLQHTWLCDVMPNHSSWALVLSYVK